MPRSPPHLILASGSRIRRQLLEAAGVTIEVVTSRVDEEALRRTMAVEQSAAAPREIASALAAAKATAVSTGRPDALVVGADQVLSIGGEILSKPGDVATARAHLQRLRGRSHQLHSAVVIARAGQQLWSYVETAELTMRAFSDTFLTDYLERAGDGICACVGAYELEGLGLQLFERIEGDHTTILGLPLLPLMTELRALGAIAT